MNTRWIAFLGVIFVISLALADSPKSASAQESPAGLCCATPSNTVAPLRQRKKLLLNQTPTNGTEVLTFEGLQNDEPVEDFYNGGLGGNGSGPGPNFGITFSGNSLALIDADAGGTGNFGGEPSPDTIMFFLTGAAATMNVPAGFQTGFSFFYSTVNIPGLITVYDDVNATGNVLATLVLPLTPVNGHPDPTGVFSPLVPIGVSFSGTAKSVDFGGTGNQIGFDNITLGSATAPCGSAGSEAPDQENLCLSQVHAWTGLKNSDDQGTQFDLKAELLRNGTPVASGLTRCITSLTRNPSSASEVVVPFDELGPLPVDTGDVLSLRLSVRIGTNADGSKCAGPGGSHNSAVGLRFYYDSTSRLSRFDAFIGPNPIENLYLHSDGGPCPNGGGQSPGVTARTLDPTAPAGSSAKCKDSGIVNFGGGNPFSAIGTWSLAPLP